MSVDLDAQIRFVQHQLDSEIRFIDTYGGHSGGTYDSEEEVLLYKAVLNTLNKLKEIYES